MTGSNNFIFADGSTPPITTIQEVGRFARKSYQWLSITFSLGAIIGLCPVMLILLLNQSRIFHSMATDGFFPKYFAKTHHQYKTPSNSIIFVGYFASILSAAFPTDILGHIASVGVLPSFIIVHASVIMLRFTRPDIERRFAAPGGKRSCITFPILGIVLSFLLIVFAEETSIWILLAWTGVGWIIYFYYSIRLAKFHVDPIGHFAEVLNIKSEPEAQTEQEDNPQSISKLDVACVTTEAGTVY